MLKYSIQLQQDAHKPQCSSEQLITTASWYKKQSTLTIDRLKNPIFYEIYFYL